MPSYVITGASRGMGYAFVTHLASIQGNTVIGLARNKSATDARLAADKTLDDTAKKDIHILQADVTDLPSLETAATETAKITGGAVDVLINNAAFISRVSSWKTIVDVDAVGFAKDLDDSLRANLFGVAYTIDAFLPLIRKGSVKKVLTLSTGMADLDFVNNFGIAIASPYAISKAATNMLVAKYNAALGKSEGILFFSISPGVVDSSEGVPPSEEDMIGGAKMGAQFAEYAPNFRMMTPPESVKIQLDVLDKATVETMGGAFVSHFGNKQWL